MKYLVTLSAITLIVVAALPTSAAIETNRPFRVGEKLIYQIFWGPFIAGRATLEVQAVESCDGNDCYRLVAKIATSGLADVMYPVRSTFESWLDVDDMCVRRAVMDRSEGKKKRHTVTTYDYDLKTSVTTNHVNGKVFTLPITPGTQDPITSFYYARSQSLVISNSFSFPINTGDTNVTCSLMPDERKDYTLRPVGEVPALRIEPNPTLTIVSKNGGRMWFWVSDDARKLPLVVVSNLKFGSIKLVLHKIESAIPLAVKTAAKKPTTNFN